MFAGDRVSTGNLHAKTQVRSGRNPKCSSRSSAPDRVSRNVSPRSSSASFSPTRPAPSTRHRWASGALRWSRAVARDRGRHLRALSQRRAARASGRHRAEFLCGGRSRTAGVLGRAVPSSRRSAQVKPTRSGGHSGWMSRARSARAAIVSGVASILPALMRLGIGSRVLGDRWRGIRGACGAIGFWIGWSSQGFEHRGFNSGLGAYC